MMARKNDIEMYSKYNEGKSVVAERSIRTLYVTSVSKNVYINNLNDIANKYNNTYYSKINMKPVDVKPKTYIDSSKEINNKDPKFKIGDIVRISKYKYLFVKGYTPNWSEEVFVTKKVKNTVSWTYVINDVNGQEIVGTFYEKHCKEQVKN